MVMLYAYWRHYANLRRLTFQHNENGNAPVKSLINCEIRWGTPKNPKPNTTKQYRNTLTVNRIYTYYNVYSPVCLNCWCLQTIATLTKVKTQFIYENPNFELYIPMKSRKIYIDTMILNCSVQYRNKKYSFLYKNHMIFILSWFKFAI